jgi:single-strand DNA-binding protein
MKNRVQLIGHVGQEPEIKNLESGRVANFTIATNENYTNAKGEKVEQTEWHNIVLWRGLAELATKYLHKGSLVHIEGSLRTRSWEDKDKNRRFMTEIIASNLVMLDKRAADHRGDNDATEIIPSHDIIDDSLSNGANDLADELPF